MSEYEYEQTELDLGPKRQRFVKEYLVDLTATQAAQRSGYSGSKAAERLMASPVVRAAIHDELAAQCERIGIRADDIVRGFCQIAFGDPRKLFDDNDCLKRPSKWTKEEAMQISSFVVTQRTRQDGTIETATRVQLHDRLRALDLLARRLWPEVNTPQIDAETVRQIIEQQEADNPRVVLMLPHNNRDPLPPGRWVNRDDSEDGAA